MIARSCCIPSRPLSIALGLLVRAGLLESRTGPNGGYRFVGPASKITLLDIIEVVDGPVRVTIPSVGKNAVNIEQRLQMVFDDAATAVRQLLGRFRVVHLVKRWEKAG
jgi:Rrf2 family protein